MLHDSCHEGLFASIELCSRSQEAVLCLVSTPVTLLKASSLLSLYHCMHISTCDQINRHTTWYHAQNLTIYVSNQPVNVAQIVRGNYLPIASTYSKGLKDLVDMTLRVDPKRRPTVNEVLKMPVLQERIAKFLSATVRCRVLILLHQLCKALHAPSTGYLSVQKALCTALGRALATL